jgi:hypothetical protein
VHNHHRQTQDRAKKLSHGYIRLLRARQAGERKLQELEIAYQKLLDEHVSLWSNFVMGSLPSRNLANAEDTDAILLLESSIHEILSFCRQAIGEIEAESVGSPDWNKTRGKILAYGRVTAVLHRLQTKLRALDSFVPEPGEEPAVGEKKVLRN